MKRGFTLIELLAVLTILTFILLTTIPVLTKTIDNSKEKAKINSIDLYGIAIENAVADYYTENSDKENVTLKELEDGNYLKYNGSKVECNEIQIAGRKVYLNDCKVGNKYVEHSYGKVTPQPELAPGLIPVEYDGNKWIVTEVDSESWYNYDNQQWANAVTLLPGVIKDVGDEVKVDGTEAAMMLVWIPRYEYKYTNLGDQYAGGTQELPGGIDINFILPTRTTPSSNEYKIHPAFTFGDKELSGIWVGKFELSHETLSSNTTANNLGCSSTSCANASGLRILPNKVSLRYNNVSNFWYGIRSIENTSSFGLDTPHMMKNSEWGAVAYLSQSKYGKYGNNNYDNKYKEVYQNRSSSYITGSSNGTPSQETTNTQCAYNDMQDLGEDTNGYKKGQCGPGASTTGNIYGVYDMSGGSWEYVMGVYGPEYPTIGSSGFGSTVFTGNTIESKYYDKYANSTNSDTNDGSLSCSNGICYGHAMSETASWYGDYTYMVSSSYPWFLRGGGYGGSTAVGVFGRGSDLGSSYNGTSARVVGFGK